MIRIAFIFCLLFSNSDLLGQDNKSRTTAFMDSINNLNDPINWGEDLEYISNVEKLAEIALEEDSFEIYESCVLSANVVYHRLDDYLGLAKSIERVQEKIHNSTRFSLGFKLSLLDVEATLLRLTGDMNSVIDKRLEVIELLHRLDLQSEKLPRIYANLAIDYNFIGDLVQSKLYSLKALENLEYNESSAYLIAFFYHNLAKIDFRETNYEEAIPNFKIADYWLNKGEVVPIKTDRLKISNNLLFAEALIHLEDWELVNELLEKAASLQRNVEFRKYRYFEVKGIYYLASDKIDSSLIYLKESIMAISKKNVRGSEVLVVPRLYLNLAKFYATTNQLDSSLVAVQYGLSHFVDSLNVDIQFNPSISDFRYSEIALQLMSLKSDLCKKKYFLRSSNYNLKNTMEAYNYTLDLLSNMRGNFLNNESKFYVLEKAIPVYNSYLDLVFDHYEKNGDDSDKDLLYDIIGQTKSAILSDKINYKNLVNDPNSPPSLIDKEKDLRLKRALYKKQVKKLESEDSIQVEKLASMKDSLFSFNQDYDILDKNIREANEAVAGWNLNDDIELDQLSKLMMQDEMIIDYYVSDEYIYYVAILNGETFVDRVFLESVKDDIINFVDYISQPPTVNSRLNVVELSDNIFSSLLKPYIENRSSVKSLRILPSGLLNTLPFEALSYEVEGITKYLVEDCPIVYSVSRSQLLQKEELSSSYNIMALAPKFESDIISDTRYACDGAELSNLKYAQEEVGYIQNAYAVTNNDSISASYFLENISNNDICHLATHGCVNASDPMLSEIFFNDQPVTGYDVMNLDTDLSLMFLSACNTARGEDVQGEGVIGLTSGFFEAGVRNMISSLWSIDDLASSQIVKGFYKNVKEGDTYSQALRASKLEYLESADKLRSHPYYWAGLVQIGAGVTVEKSTLWWVYLGGFGVLALGFMLWNSKHKSTSIS